MRIATTTVITHALFLCICLCKMLAERRGRREGRKGQEVALVVEAGSAEAVSHRV